MKKGTITIEVVVIILLVMLVLIFAIPFISNIKTLLKGGTSITKIDSDTNDGKIAQGQDASSPQNLLPPRNVIPVYYQNKVTISWLKSTSQRIESYSVSREEEGKPPINICDLPAKDLEKYTCIDDKGGLNIGTKYKYTVTTYDINGQYSEVAVEVVPNRLS